MIDNASDADIDGLLKQAENEINAQLLKEAKAAAASDIAAAGGSIVNFFGAIFNAREIGQQSNMSLLQGIFSLIAMFLSMVTGLFN